MKTIVNILCIMLLTNVSILCAQPARDTLLEKPLPRITGWADNMHYIREVWVPAARSYSAVAVNIRTGEKKAYEPAQKTVAGKVELRKGDIFLISETGERRLTATEVAEATPILSPNGRWVAFTRNNDLYTIDLSDGREIRYTHDGSDVILNGYAPWVYYEEILKRESNHCAFWWSPDSRHLAFYRFDENAVPLATLYNATGHHGFLEQTRYPKAGDPNPEVMVGMINMDKGTITWGDINPKDDQYLGTPFWRPDGSGLLVQWMPREQNNLKLYDIHPESGTKTEIYNEYQATWVDWINRLRWVNDGFLMVRDFDGWEQIYYHAHNGQLKHKLTSGKNWGTRIIRVDEKRGLLFYQSNAELSTRTDLYRVRLNGKQQKRLTFGEFNHEKLLISPDGEHFLTTYSNRQTPTRIAIVNTSSGKMQLVADSKGEEFDRREKPLREMVWITTEDGFKLPGIVIWPEKMEAGEKYPVIIRVYGGPNRASVHEKWNSLNGSRDNEQLIRLVIDHRGSGHCGKEGMNYLYRNLGKWELQDYIAWAQWLRTLPAVDPDKILITGGSYGGYMTALALTSGAGYFNYGIADYPVTDWMLYDSHYTERYMDHPKDNPEGYKQSSVLSHAEKYQSRGKSMLLIQHGSMDDNVHIQNTLQLVDLFQRLNKSFEVMVYPTERHGWKGPKIPFTQSLLKRFREQYLYAED